MPDDVKPLEVAVEEYRHLWAYYHRTLDERKNLLDWYFKVVELPAAAIGYLVANGNGSVSVDPQTGAGVLGVVGLIGIAIYGTYAKESANAGKYQASMARIREFFRRSNQELDLVLTIDRERAVNPNRSRLGSIRAWRGAMVALANSLVGTASLALALHWHTWCAWTLTFVGFAAVHLVLYERLYERYQGD